ncbi:MAG: hypothetical protein V3V01_13620 [Acidimicrobiales bacterium]
MSLISRQLEQAGIPTVVLGSARDIVEQAGVARFVFVDFPLGNPAGKPYDTVMQAEIASLTVDVLEHAVAARTTVQASVSWGSDQWRTNYMALDSDGKPVKPDPRPGR